MIISTKWSPSKTIKAIPNSDIHKFVQVPNFYISCKSLWSGFEDQIRNIGNIKGILIMGLFLRVIRGVGKILYTSEYLFNRLDSKLFNCFHDGNFHIVCCIVYLIFSYCVLLLY